MKFHTVFIIIIAVCVLIYSLSKKYASPKFHVKVCGLRKIFFALVITFFVVSVILPRKWLGKWNAISSLDDTRISAIILRPSSPEWKVNLSGVEIRISNQKQIDTLLQLLRNTDVYFPSHPSRIWEINMEFITNNNQKFSININQTENNGCVIYTADNEWRNDDLKFFLERITDYWRPVYGDTTTVRY